MAYFGNKPSDQAIKIGENTILSSMIDDGVIVNADINSSASIDATKLADGTITSTELQYINTLSSNAQTQLNAKAPIASPTFTGNFTSVGIDDNADALALTIDSSERVGLGQPSPICKLHIKDSNPIVAIDRQANDEKVSLNFISRDTVNYGQWGIVMNHSGADTTTPDFSFYNYKNTTEALKLSYDGSATFAGQLKVGGGHLATQGTYGLRGYGVGSLGDTNVEYIGMWHSTSGPKLVVDKAGTGSYRSLQIQTGGSTALTLDTSQNATFEKQVKAETLSVNSGSTEFPVEIDITSSTEQQVALEVRQMTSGNDARLRFKSADNGYCRFGMESDGDFFIEPWSGSAYVKQFHLDSATGTATFAGNITQTGAQFLIGGRHGFKSDANDWLYITDENSSTYVSNVSRLAGTEFYGSVRIYTPEIWSTAGSAKLLDLQDKIMETHGEIRLHDKDGDGQFGARISYDNSDNKLRIQANEVSGDDVEIMANDDLTLMSGTGTALTLNGDQYSTFSGEMLTTNGMRQWSQSQKYGGSGGTTHTILRQWHDHANWGFSGFLVEVWLSYYSTSVINYASYYCSYCYSGGDTEVEQIAHTGEVSAPTWTTATQSNGGSGNTNSRDLQIHIGSYIYANIRVTSPMGTTTNSSHGTGNAVYYFD